MVNNMNIVYRLLLSSILIVAVALAVAPVVVASHHFDITMVRGQVFGPDGKALKDARVIVTCGGDTGKGWTDRHGKYSVEFRGRYTCDEGE